MHISPLILTLLLPLLTSAAPASSKVDSQTMILLEKAKCPNFRHTNVNQYLGPSKVFRCNWKQALNCAGFVVACSVPCLASTFDMNPFLIPACAGCVGVTAAHCAECFSEHGGRNGVCEAVRKDPQATCLEPLCRDSKTVGQAPKGEGEGVTAT